MFLTNSLIKILVISSALLAIGISPVLSQPPVPVYTYTYNDAISHQASADYTTYFPCGACQLIIDDVQILLHDPSGSAVVSFCGQFPVYSSTVEAQAYFTVSFGSVTLSHGINEYDDNDDIICMSYSGGSNWWDSSTTLKIYASYSSYPTVAIYTLNVNNYVSVYRTATLATTLTQAPTAGGTITLTGAQFGPTISSVRVNVATIGDLTCTMTVAQTTVTCTAPAHAAGSLSATVYINKAQDPSITTSLPFTCLYANPVVNTIPFRGVPTTGGTLTITGANLGPTISTVAVSVATVGTLSCSMTVSTTTVVCTLPAHATTSTLDITVTVTSTSTPSVNTFSNAIQWYTAQVVNTPSAMQLQIMDATFISFFGSNLGNSASDIVVSVDTIGTLSCSILVADTTIRCVPSAHAATSPLTVTITVTRLNNPITFTFPGALQYANPVITSVSPNIISVAGGVVTFSGDRFGFYPSFYTGVSATSVTGTISSLSGHTTAVVNMNARSVATASGAYLPVTFSWSGSSSTSGNLLAFATPTISSISSGASISRYGGTMTIAGTYFGNTVGYYDGVYVTYLGSTKMTGTIQSMSDTSMTINFGAFSGTPSIWITYNLRLTWLTASGYVELSSSVTVT